MSQVALTEEDLVLLSDAVLAKGGSLWFRARGFSMSPFLRDRDHVMVRQVGPSSFARGSILLCRGPHGGLVAHRVVNVVRNGNENSVEAVMLADSSGSTLLKVAGDEVLGEVVALRRGDKIVYLNRGFRGMGGRFAACHRYSMHLLLRVAGLPRRVGAHLVRRVQDGAPYRHFVARFVRSRVRTCVVPKRDVCRSTSVRKRIPEIVNRKVDRKDTKICGQQDAGNDHLIHALLWGKVIGSVELARLPDYGTSTSDLWLFSLWTNPFLRRAGIGERLVQETLDKARDLGAGRVHAFVQTNNLAAQALYDKLGFNRSLEQSLEPGSRLRTALTRQASLLVSKSLESAWPPRSPRKTDDERIFG